ncbi:MAG: PPOX class F420-dependent oxidoreductase [Chloroflexi bacterium]|nr:PPOX class F420-dependent oxidoreductase [Chloroflexota bacterium]
MAVQLTDAQKKLLVEGTNFVHFATINKDGSTQVTPVWVDFDGTHVLVNSEETRRKVRNVKRDPRVSISVQAPDNPYQYTEIRGRVVEITAAGGAEHIDKMAKKYMGADKYPYNQPGDVRVILKIVPEHVSGMG